VGGTTQGFLDGTHSGTAVFVGNSIGALLSLMVVADYPEIAGGVLINSAGGLSHRPHESKSTLTARNGNLNRLIRAKLTGRVLFDRVRQNHNSAHAPASLPQPGGSYR